MRDRITIAPPRGGKAAPTAAQPKPAAVLAVALRQTEARLTAIVDSIDQMIWSSLPDGHHDYYNARWYEFTGIPGGATVNEAWNDLFHADDRERVWTRWQHSLATGEPYHIEYRLRHHTGQHRWVIGRAQPVRDESGRITRWYGTCTDVHDLKTAEEARDLIAQELAHRIKNTFALISGLVAMSVREHPAARPFADVLQARIMALAQAQAFIHPSGSYDEAPGERTLMGLVGTLMAPYRSDGGQRVLVQGDDAVVGPAACTALSLVFHELGTNAVKHGALVTDHGHVVVTCERSDDAMTVTWEEHGGLSIDVTPVHRGFGLGMSERVVRAQLGADLSYRWDRGGLVARIAVPMARLGQ